MGQYIQFVFWRLEPSFQALESNERIVAKQAFLGTWESNQNRALLVSYSLTGLRSDCDLLCIRAAESLELLQDMTCRVQTSGLGKFLSPTFSYLGLASTPYAAKPAEGRFVPGQGRYLFFSPWASTAESRALPAAERQKTEAAIRQAAEKRGLRLHPPLRGLDDADELVAVEAEKPEEAAAFQLELRDLRGETASPAGPTFIGVLKDIRDIIDCLG